MFNFNADSRLRGHKYKIVKNATNKKLYQHFFTNRIVNEWNKLPEDIADAKTLNEFKNKIDEKFKDIMYKTHILQ